MKNFNTNKPVIRYLRLFLFSIIFAFLSCKKQDDFLNVKANKNDVTPATLQDFQAVLDNTDVMNNSNSIFGLLGTDNIYIPDANLDAIDAPSRNAYLWAKDIYGGAISSDWFYLYRTVEYANIVLDGFDKLNSDQASTISNNIKGSALFYRAFAFYQLCQLFCKPYVASSASNDLGIPLRLSSDINVKSVRASVQASYDQMISDIKTAAALLPVTPLYKTRPSAVAANALLAKIYLAMGDYSNAYHFADKILNDYNTLLDYNTLTKGTTNPFPSFSSGNPEIIYYAFSLGNPAVWSVASTKARVSPDLYQTYDAGDVRKTAFYNAYGTTGRYIFKGNYSGVGQVRNFSGIGTDEVYLIRAECLARAGNLTASLLDLNALLKKRYTPATFVAYSTSDQNTLLNKIVLERRKEMPFNANVRWEDLRRLNMEARFAVTLNRTYKAQQYVLVPNDNRYVFPIPDDEIRLNGLQQNPR